MRYSLLFERTEKWFIYVSIISVLFLETAVRFGITSWSLSLDQKVALLIFNFLLIFRIIDKRLLSERGYGVGEFSVGFVHVFCRDIDNATIFANDAMKYYQFFSQTKFSIAELQLIIFDDTYVHMWQSLKDRGRIGKLTVIKAVDRPSFHFATADSKRGMFGFFVRLNGRISALDAYYFSNSDRDGNRKLEDLTKIAHGLKPIAQNSVEHS